MEGGTGLVIQNKNLIPACKMQDYENAQMGKHIDTFRVSLPVKYSTEVLSLCLQM